MDLEFLKVMYCAGALIGLHLVILVEPYLSLITSAGTTYSKIIPAFQQLYQELLDADQAALLQTKEPALKFVSKERFQQIIYKEDL